MLAHRTVFQPNKDQPVSLSDREKLHCCVNKLQKTLRYWFYSERNCKEPFIPCISRSTTAGPLDFMMQCAVIGISGVCCISLSKTAYVYTTKVSQPPGTTL
ncbi:hypothetical protein XENOCAPTIV_013716 [Xenoophorus captivus]|uniref:Uncharacterized protein n=1 Tax=Xenoophorus captivus TaxID=1517983 RepID=A0ABV0QRP3_9TELE